MNFLFFLIVGFFGLIQATSAQANPTRELQQLLNERKCHAGEADGHWGRRTEQAAQQLSFATGVRINNPVSESTLEALRGIDVICPLVLPEELTPAVGFRLGSLSVNAPRRLKGGVQEFQLDPGNCDDVHHARSTVAQSGTKTSDCDRRRQRLEMDTTKRAGHGSRLIYTWEIFVPDDFRSTGTDDRLIAGQFHNGFAPSAIFTLRNDTGYVISDKRCFGPNEFGKWNKVVVRVYWHSKRKRGLRDVTPGVFEVWCNGELILDRSGRPNVGKDTKISFKYGLYHAKDFPAGDNIRLLYRNVVVSNW